MIVGFLAVLATKPGLAQNAPGARASGMGGAYLVMHDVWSAVHNQAGIVYSESPQAGVFYENRFGMKELSDKGIVASVPFRKSAFAISYRSFGYSGYSLSRAGLAYAMKLSDKFSAGIQLNYLSTRLGENYGTNSGLSAEAGFLYKMNEKISLAAHLYNPNRTKLSDYNDERIPSKMRFGAGYRFSEKVILTGEVQKPSDSKATVRAGIEYVPVKNLSLRAGFASDPSQYAFGFGYRINAFQIDAATGYHLVLGFTPQISLTFLGKDV
ncbi:MAG: hypothetical protein K1X54_04065 [Flavobacteriales bacterium]|nr:hypothetical protein [Flavobacteriales bacterium]